MDAVKGMDVHCCRTGNGRRQFSEMGNDGTQVLQGRKMIEPIPDSYMTIPDLAKTLLVSDASVRRWIRRDGMASSTLQPARGGRPIRLVSRSDAARFLDRRILPFLNRAGPFEKLIADKRRAMAKFIIGNLDDHWRG